jgi:cell division protein ZapA
LPTVDISINGRLYGVACDEGQEPRIRDLAASVDARVRQLVGGRPSTVGESHVLVLASLMLADELDEAKTTLAAQAEPPGAEDDEEVLVAAVEHLAERISSIADRLDRA